MLKSFLIDLCQVFGIGIFVVYQFNFYHIFKIGEFKRCKVLYDKTENHREENNIENRNIYDYICSRKKIITA